MSRLSKVGLQPRRVISDGVTAIYYRIAAFTSSVVLGLNLNTSAFSPPPPEKKSHTLLGRMTVQVTGCHLVVLHARKTFLSGHPRIVMLCEPCHHFPETTKPDLRVE